MRNGIRVGPKVEAQSTSGCQPDTFEWVPISRMAGTPLAIQPKYLPPGARFDSASGDICKTAAGQVVHNISRASYFIETNRSTGNYGATIYIDRFRGQPAVRADIPDERWTTTTIAGHPAVIARPILPDGYGHTVAIVYANGVLTRVTAENLPTSELVRIVEGLF